MQIEYMYTQAFQIEFNNEKIFFFRMKNGEQTKNAPIVNILCFDYGVHMLISKCTQHSHTNSYTIFHGIFRVFIYSIGCAR